jgi:hypothetical protein
MKRTTLKFDCGSPDNLIGLNSALIPANGSTEYYFLENQMHFYQGRMVVEGHPVSAQNECSINIITLQNISSFYKTCFTHQNVLISLTLLLGSRDSATDFSCKPGITQVEVKVFLMLPLSQLIKATPYQLKMKYSISRDYFYSS